MVKTGVVTEKGPVLYAAKGATVAKKIKLYIENTIEAEPDNGERVKLDERTALILEEELQGIMIKIWQALPDNPPSPAERYVTERLRVQASDDIRNVLGLNVTKRLLNVFNPMFLRLNFSAKPEEHDLMEFTKTYNISAMPTDLVTNNSGRPSYTARVADVADFDRLCNAKQVVCGNSTVTVYPRYKFHDCPIKLTTGFTKKTKSPNTTIIQTVKGNTETSNENCIQQNATNSNNANVTMKASQSSEAKESDNNKVTQQNNTNKDNIAKNDESNQNKKVKEINKTTEVSKVKQRYIASDAQPNLPKALVTQNRALKAKPSQIYPEAINKNTKKEISNTASIIKINKEVVTTKNNTEVIPKEAASTIKKVMDGSKSVGESIPSSPGTSKKVAATPKSSVKKVIKPKVTKLKPHKNVVGSKKTNSSKPKILKKAVPKTKVFEQNEEDDYEMNDEEILALISTGVVVDECSGSDVE